MMALSGGNQPGGQLSAASTRALWIAALLLISFALRAFLAAQGGQHFFGDEHRFQIGTRLYLAVLNGDMSAIRQVLGAPEHALFPVITAGVTAAQHLLAQFTPYGDWSNPAHVELTLWLGAIGMAAISTLNLWLVYRLATVLGGNPERALWTLALAAGTNVFLYQARHLLPYSAALAMFMGGMLVCWGSATARRALLGGALVGLSYHTYNGYWFLIPVAALASAWWWLNAERRWTLCGFMAGGLALGLVVPLAVGFACAGMSYWTTMRAFSQSVTQGLFAEGWSLPWEFFWQSEGPLFLGVSVAVLIALVTRRPLPREAQLAIGMLAASYGLLVLMSVGLARFVVYARTVLPLWLFVVLLGGWAIQSLVKTSWGKRVALLALGLISVSHFAPHFSRVFPREFEIAVLRHYGNPKHTLSVSGSLYIPLALPVARPDLAIVNAQLLYPVRAYLGFPSGKELIVLNHPLSYKPYQYESHTPHEREMLRTQDIRMKLIELADPTLPNDLPFAHRYQNEDRPTGRQSAPRL